MTDKTTKTTNMVSKPAMPAKAESSRMLSPFEEMERLFESFWPRGWMQPWHWDPM